MFNHTQNFSSFSVDDIEKAKSFYSGVLQLDVKDNPMGVIELHTGTGAPVMIYPKPNHQSATFTVLNFPVNNIEEAVDYLAGKGITMEQYTGDIQTDSKGIMRDGDHAIAWFKDPAGNILSVTSPGPSQGGEV